MAMHHRVNKIETNIKLRGIKVTVKIMSFQMTFKPLRLVVAERTCLGKERFPDARSGDSPNVVVVFGVVCVTRVAVNLSSHCYCQLSVDGQ